MAERSPWRTASAALSIGGEVLGLLMQLALVWVGADLLWGGDDDLMIAQRFVWCSVAMLYLALTALALSLQVRIRQPDPTATRVLIGHPVTRLFTMVFTFGASVIGLSVAVDLITDIGQDVHDPIAEFTAVWAMLLSWVMFNWGYARIYFSRFHRSSAPPLEFPGTPSPRLADFAYFAFTNSTTFSVSDVKVLDTHMRWTVVWHTTFAFFFNALIIALSMNVIANGQLFAELFS
ncbi:DUF1345 domain-containing protein [Leucobacter allii]|uniref:DUF1345 domain-containing protein n=1 Tax=Leucobacter allii TaxID=2932247 RepID=A0ABY4FM73_9MICO|nr:DUF1345 domain-containing protein [Leucobacter allii]UOQ57315.1 DUF1345 domain-containing protein [Leucobacter allii]UOR01764.1 DUF1345 domain-containing protein [Leucobacter allii]